MTRDSWQPGPFAWGAVIIAMAVLAAFAGYFVGDRDPTPTRVDVGFLQDMLDHHDQAIVLAKTLQGAGGTPDVEHYANEIVATQMFENGQMLAWLEGWDLTYGDPERRAMAWMGPGFPVSGMPGMAPEEDVQRLNQLEGRPADELFIRLMIAHHRGGIGMAEFARRHGEDASQGSRLPDRAISGDRDPGTGSRSREARSAAVTVRRAMVRTLVFVIAATLLALAAFAGEASAHEGAGAIALASEATIEPDLVRYDVLVTFVADGHPASGATVTAVLVRPDSPAATPVPLQPLDQEGHYGVDIRFPSPGPWLVRFTSVSPVASLEHSLLVQPGPTSTEPTTPPPVSAARVPVPSDGGNGSDAGLIALFIAVGLALIGVIGWMIVTRRKGP